MLSHDWSRHTTIDGKLFSVSPHCGVLVSTSSKQSCTRLTFGVFGTACFLAYLWATYIVPETANVSLEMIDEVFRSPASQGDMVMKKQVGTP